MQNTSTALQKEEQNKARLDAQVVAMKGDLDSLQTQLATVQQVSVSCFPCTCVCPPSRVTKPPSPSLVLSVSVSILAAQREAQAVKELRADLEMAKSTGVTLAANSSSKLDGLQRKFDDLQKSCSSEVQERQKLQAQNATLDKALKESQSNLDGLQRKFDNLQKSCSSEVQERQKLQAQNANLDKALKESQSKLQEQNARFEKALKESQSKLASEQNAIQGLKQHCVILQQQLNQEKV